MPFGIHVRTFFHHFGIIFSSIVFAPICYQSWDELWYHFWCLFVFVPFACATCNTFKYQCFYDEFVCSCPSEKTLFLMISMICSILILAIDFGYVLVSILSHFWHPFGINVSVLGCSFLIYLFLHFVCEFATLNKVPESRPRILGLAAASKKSRFGAAIVKRKRFYWFGAVLGSIWRWIRTLLR